MAPSPIGLPGTASREIMAFPITKAWPDVLLVTERHAPSGCFCCVSKGTPSFPLVLAHRTPALAASMRRRIYPT